MFSVVLLGRKYRLFYKVSEVERNISSLCGGPICLLLLLKEDNEGCLAFKILNQSNLGIFAAGWSNTVPLFLFTFLSYELVVP